MLVQGIAATRLYCTAVILNSSKTIVDHFRALKMYLSSVNKIFCWGGGGGEGGIFEPPPVYGPGQYFIIGNYWYENWLDSTWQQVEFFYH